MKGRLSIHFVGLLAVFFIAVIFSLSACVGSDDEEDYDGIWCYTPHMEIEPREFEFEFYRPGHHLVSGYWTSEWSGTFSGEAKEHGFVIQRDEPKGMRIFVDRITFDSVEVDGKTGGLDIYLYGEGRTGEFEGKWFIADASGELEGLEGRGNLWGPGFLGQGCGEIYYSVEELEGLEIR